MSDRSIAKLPSTNDLKKALVNGVVVITATQRLARQLLLDVAPNTGVSRVPSILSLDTWLQTASAAIEEQSRKPRRVLKASEAHLLWCAIIEAAQRKSNDFHLIQPSSAAELAARCRTVLKTHEVPTQQARVREAFAAETDTQLFLSWLDAIESSLKTNCWLMMEDCYRVISEGAPTRQPEVWFLSEEPPPAALRRALTASFHAVTWFHSEPWSETYTARAYDTLSEEIAAAAVWGKKQHDQRRNAVIVLLEYQRDRVNLEHHLRQAFEVSDERFTRLPVNFSRGVELSKTPMYRDALIFLKSLSQPIDRNTILALFRSPFFRWTDGVEALKARALRQVFDTAHTHVSPATLLDVLRTSAPEAAITQVLESARRQRTVKQKYTFWEWRDIISELLARAGWPAAAGLDSLEYQQYDLFESVLDTLEIGNETAGPVSFEDAMTVLSATLDRRIFQPKTEVAHLQVMFLRDTLGLSFDSVRVVGATSDSLPPRLAHLSFIPWSIARKYGFQSTADNERVSAGLLGALHASEDCELSFHKRADNSAKHPSHFIGRATLLLPERMSVRTHERFSVETVTDSQGSGLAIPATQKGGVSVLEDLAYCPLKAHLRHALDLQPLKPPIQGLSPAERGRLVHLALQHLFVEHDDSEAINRLTGLAATLAAREAAERAIAEVSAALRDRVGLAALDLEAMRLEALLARWIAVEQTRSQAFRIEATETTLEWSCEGLTFRFKADRIDVLASGERVVIDYKTGALPSHKDWTSSPIMSPQLPSYTQVIADVGVIAIAAVAAEKPVYQTLGESIGLESADKKSTKALTEVGCSTLDDLQAVWKQELTRLVSDFIAGHAAATPSATGCRYCKYDVICRVKMIDQASATEDPSGD